MLVGIFMGVFNCHLITGSFLEIRNSLGVVKRQEKELTLYYEDIDNDEILEDKEFIENESSSSKKEEIHRMFTEETLALAIIGTAFVALLLGFFLGMFVTRTCSPKDAPQSSPKSSSSSLTASDDMHKYSVTTISSHCEDMQQQHQSQKPKQQTNNEFDPKISVENENQFKSLPPQFSIGQSQQQPMSLNPTNLDRQRYKGVNGSDHLE